MGSEGSSMAIPCAIALCEKGSKWMMTPPPMSPGKGPGYFGGLIPTVPPMAFMMLQAKHMWIISCPTMLLSRCIAGALLPGKSVILA